METDRRNMQRFMRSVAAFRRKVKAWIERTTGGESQTSFWKNYLLEEEEQWELQSGSTSEGGGEGSKITLDRLWEKGEREVTDQTWSTTGWRKWTTGFK